ncbi:MAG: MazG-like family protein [Salinibacter sp.]
MCRAASNFHPRGLEVRRGRSAGKGGGGRFCAGSKQGRRRREEIADVLIYALLFFERLGIDPLEAISDKLQKNREKFPTKEVRGEETL